MRCGARDEIFNGFGTARMQREIRVMSACSMDSSSFLAANIALSSMAMALAVPFNTPRSEDGSDRLRRQAETKASSGKGRSSGNAGWISSVVEIHWRVPNGVRRLQAVPLDSEQCEDGRQLVATFSQALEQALPASSRMRRRIASIESRSDRRTSLVRSRGRASE